MASPTAMERARRPAELVVGAEMAPPIVGVLGQAVGVRPQWRVRPQRAIANKVIE